MDGRRSCSGIVLAGTHWGWVHVAELTGNRIEGRREASLAGPAARWLSQIEPYPRWDVSTRADERRARSRSSPSAIGPSPPASERSRSRAEEWRASVHRPDEPAAAVAERAELLRRKAARGHRGTRGTQSRLAREAYEEALMVA